MGAQRTENEEKGEKWMKEVIKEGRSGAGGERPWITSLQGNGKSACRETTPMEEIKK